MSKLTLLFLFLFYFFIYSITYAQQSSDYVKSIIEKAKNEKVYNDKEWYTLIHYKKFPLRSVKSLVDDNKFFFAKDGKINPEAELIETIKAMFNPDISKDNDNNHPVCRYAGRREFLIKRLNIDRNKLPKKICSDYEKYFNKLDPTSVTLVFPFMYMKNPASMFGHTMLRINNRRNDPLTSHSVTFAANLPENINGLSYMFKGLFGGYYGYFGVQEYYKTIFEYGNTEKRDIWEYDLNLTKDETIKLFNHLWEMQDIGSDYWFIDENCSYNLLLLLESARPEAELSVSIFWEVPPNTVKLLNEKGFIINKKYRPSHLKVMENYARGLPIKAIDIAQDVALGKKIPEFITNSNYSQKEKISMFDLAIEGMRFEFLKKTNITEDDFNKYKQNTIELLKERAKIKIPSPNRIKEPKSAHLGHDISRVQISVGTNNFNEVYNDFGFRLGFHSLEDIDFGYLPNSQLTFFDATLRYNYMTDKVTVPDATLVSIGSYAPITSMMQSVSWQIDIKGEQKTFTNKKSYFTPYIKGAVGATFAYEDFYFWLMADVDFSFAPAYSTYAGIGLGGNTGISYSFTWGKILTRAFYRYYVLGGSGAEIGANASYILPVSQNNALELKYEYKNYWKQENQSLQLNWNFYFK